LSSSISGSEISTVSMGPPECFVFVYAVTKDSPPRRHENGKPPERPVGETKRIADARSVQAVIRLGKELSGTA